MNELFLIGLQNAAVAFVLAIFVWGVTRVWRSSPVVHVLWLLVLVKLLTPPIIPIDVAGWVQPRSIPVSQNSTPTAGNSTTNITEYPGAALPVAGRSVSPGVVYEPERVAFADNDDWQANESRIFYAELSAMIEEVWAWCQPVLMWIWLGGAVVCGFLATIRIRRFQRLLKGMLPAAVSWQAIAQELSHKLGLHRVPDLRVADSVHAPLLWCGGRQCVIVLPRHLVNQLDAQQMELVLAHELAHLRRRDHWVRCVELLVSVIYWWNPVVWSVRRRLHSAEEQCCDAWVNWLFPDRVKRYAEVLLYAAESKVPERSARPILASPFFQSSSCTLKVRIQMILRGGIRHTMIRPVRALLTLLGLAVLPWSATWSSVDAEESPPPATQALVKSTDAKANTPANPFRVIGTVKLKGTDEPVANVTVTVLVDSERDPARQVLKATTGTNGKYEIAVPLGHARTWGLSDLPAGYWRDHTGSVEAFVASPEHPVFTKDFTVQREPAWQVRLRYSQPKDPKSKVWVNGYQQLVGNVLSTGGFVTQTDSGELTIPDSGGPFKITAGAVDYTCQTVEAVTLQFDKGFHPNAVSKVQELGPLSFEMIDEKGLKAKVTGAEASIVDRRVVLTFPVQTRKPEDHGRLTGRVVNQDGQPLAKASVGVAFHEKSGSGSGSDFTATTDDKGRFTIQHIPKFLGAEKNEPQLSLVVNRDGYGGIDTAPFDADYNAEGTQDVGEIRLKPGHELKVRIVDHAGLPAAGASVEPDDGSYAARFQGTRTDSEGRCVIRNLAIKRGVLNLSVQYGSSYAHAPVVLSKKEITIRLQRPIVDKPAAVATPSVKAAPIKGLAVGETAPEWNVAGWSDGKTRRLADYRGKVVVLDFWGIWCGPCLQSIPVMKDLEERYSKQGVVFLSIHTPGTIMDQIEELQAQHQWKAVTAVDGDPGGVTEKERAIIRDLDEPTSFDFTDESLEGVRVVLMKRHGFDIVIDKEKLEEESVATDATDITLKVQDISLKNALKLILDQKNLRYAIEDNALKITNKPDGLIPDRPLVTSGLTAKAYRVRVYPTFLVINKEGKVGYTSYVDPTQGEAFMKEIQAVHKELGIPFPPDKDAGGDEAVILKRLAKVQTYVFAKGIESVLAK